MTRGSASLSGAPRRGVDAGGARRVSRRRFLAGSAALLGPGLVGGGLLNGLLARAARAESGTLENARRGSGGYGPIAERLPVTPVAGFEATKWLALPEGFEYVVFGISGTPMTDGTPTPIAHDGMAAFPASRGRIRLVRNHEVRTPIAGQPRALAAPHYDPRGPGGTTTLEVTCERGVPRLVRDHVSLAGTSTNCAGGPTRARSWLSCEETTASAAEGWGRDHGYVFEVSAAADRPVVPVPLKHLGRFAHEAVAVDRRTGVLYLTEDNRGESGFYRYVPPHRGRLGDAGGRLEMLAVRDRPGFETFPGQRVGSRYPVHWVRIDDPDPSEVTSRNPSLVFRQGLAGGGAALSRLEGCWSSGTAVYFTSTNGGDAGQGQVWSFRRGGHGGSLTMVYESPDAGVLAFPDNLTVSPRRGILLCEDSEERVQHLRGLTRSGRVFDFAANAVDSFEWAGACFSADGEILFVNTQGPTEPGREGVGRTYAIWGPWERGAL